MIYDGAKILLTTCSNSKKDEKLLFVTDPTSYEVARALYDAAEGFSRKSLILMEETKMHGDDPNDVVAVAMKEADVIFGATNFSLFHSKARREAVKNGARFVNMADYNLEMLQKGGLFADFIKIGETCTKVAEKLKDKKECIITTEKGTYFTCSIENRAPNPQYGRSLEANTSSSPPDIECATCAVENTANGKIIVDGSIPHPKLGVIKEDITLIVKKGKITKILGGEEAEILKDILEEYNDPNTYNIGEIGIGLNSECKLIGRMLEDEGCAETLHFGAGDNLGFGGIVACPMHLDIIIKKPTMKVDGELILEKGKVIL
ncbi:aminopeptidase [Peptoniphilus porci]|uniref:Thermophilic metalloprotease (M29) n=1 Tax=Peptoniphilus porci TaxID=2652280 RepID=A0A1U7M0I7_9FIRM|nr:aminopeptidase [Peptoniphilus porci]OLR65066.1 hypothetical protein BIV18_05825 [Peptoniphilus porci]